MQLENDVTRFLWQIQFLHGVYSAAGRDFGGEWQKLTKSSQKILVCFTRLGVDFFSEIWYHKQVAARERGQLREKVGQRA